uniref:Mitochondrial glycoprotein family protein n=2 Tax=Chenopodium quinoa TaxID=63459 RepID=A0A803MBZ3_CHEQI
PPFEINGFKVAERPGEQWISLEKQFGENEVIKLEATMFNGSVPVPNQGEKAGLPGQDVQLHISMIVSIFKNNSNQVLEFVCSAWPDTIAISKLFVRQQAKVPLNPYTGPKFRELDDELQDSLYEFLEERQIDDTLCVFLHNYVNYKEKAEYIRWMNSVKSVMEK